MEIHEKQKQDPGRTFGTRLKRSEGPIRCRDMRWKEEHRAVILLKKIIKIG